MTLLISLDDPEWIEVLRSEAGKAGRSKQAIADELQISRTAVSLICAGKYSASLDKVSTKIAGRVMQLYAGRVWCPHRHQSISGHDCLTARTAPMSTSDPAALKHWLACRACPQNSTKSEMEFRDDRV